MKTCIRLLKRCASRLPRHNATAHHQYTTTTSKCNPHFQQQQARTFITSHSLFSPAFYSTSSEAVAVPQSEETVQPEETEESSPKAEELQKPEESEEPLDYALCEVKPGNPCFEESLRHEDYFGVSRLFTLRELFDARVHYGHKKGSRDFRMQSYLYGSRLDVDVFDLDKTFVHLQRALNFMAHMAFRDAIFLFVTKSPQHGHMVELMAKECGEFAHTRPWHDGTLADRHLYYRFAKKVKMPTVCVLLSLKDGPNDQHPALAEACKINIPTIAIVDSNVNPSLVTFPIPGNDDSIATIEFFCKVFKKAILLGKEKRREVALEEAESIKSRQIEEEQSGASKGEEPTSEINDKPQRSKESHNQPQRSDSDMKPREFTEYVQKRNDSYMKSGGFDELKRRKRHTNPRERESHNESQSSNSNLKSERQSVDDAYDLFREFHDDETD